MQNTVDNNKLANLILSNNIATREQIMQLWPYITVSRDIGQLLIAQGILQPSIYQKMVLYLEQLQVQNRPVQQQNQNQPSQQRPQQRPSVPGQQVSSQQQRSQPVKQTPPIQQTQESQKSDLTQIKKTVLSNEAAGLKKTAEESEDKPYTESSTDNRSAEAVMSMDGAELPDIKEIFRYARSIDASDIHLTVNNNLIIRRFGSLVKVNDCIITPEYMHAQVRLLLSEEQFESFINTGDMECIISVENAGRFRVTVMKQRSGWDCTARCVPDRIRSFEETGMPRSCFSLTQWAQGLVLVTGPSSCGKSSTLATLVEMINQSRPEHVITLESPIEQIFVSSKAQITQRQIGRDTMSQESALRAALREDPDIIVVGELRELSTIQLAVSAAETGHLVFGTMNTINASRTIYRLIDSFPPEEQTVIRNMVSESLRGVISQQLIPRLDGNGMVAAYEVLLITSAVANMIRKDEAYQLGTAMITGKASGMQLLDDSLNALVAQGIISQQDAVLHGLTKPQGEK